MVAQTQCPAIHSKEYGANNVKEREAQTRQHARNCRDCANALAEDPENDDREETGCRQTKRKGDHLANETGWINPEETCHNYRDTDYAAPHQKPLFFISLRIDYTIIQVMGDTRRNDQ